MGQDFDLVISGGTIVDGTGAAPFEADLGVLGDRIAAVGDLVPAHARRRHDARGRVVAPGFIDVHTHLELPEEHSRIEDLPTADNLLHMGVTSAITGNCGGSELPLGGWFDKLAQLGIAVNVGSLVGHNTIRRDVMRGDFARPPSEAELAQMIQWVGQSMREGAFGVSTGLIYVPGTYAGLDELVAVAREAGRLGGLYTTHLRDEGEHLEAAIEEALAVGRAAACPVQISHFKVASRRRWGQSTRTVQMVEEARREGLRVHVDQYLYTAGCTTLDAVLPRWLFDGGAEAARQRLQDPAIRPRVRIEMLQHIRERGRADYSYATVAMHDPNPAWNGLSIPEITLQVRGSATPDEQAEQAIDLFLAGGALMIYATMSELDVDHIFRQPFTMLACDGGVIDVRSEVVPHPRSFGNNARALALYARDRGVMELAEVVRKMTGLPATAFGLLDRGLLRAGLVADVVVFDPARVADRATFRQPKQHAVGFELVLVNGVPVLEAGQHTRARPGRILRGPAAPAFRT